MSQLGRLTPPPRGLGMLWAGGCRSRAWIGCAGPYAAKIAAALFEFLRDSGDLANPMALEDQFVAGSFTKKLLAFVLD